MGKNVLVDLAAALRERLDVIADEKSRREPDTHMARLKHVAERIEQLTIALPRPINPQLAHYLERQSYGKALELIESTIQQSTAR